MTNNFNPIHTVCQDAIGLARIGWSILPLKPRAKEPLISWRQLQHRKLEEREIVELFERHADANLGVVTGSVSRLLVLDADSPSVVAKLGVSETPIAETARGRHYYFQLPNVRIRSVAGIADGLDVRAEGGYVVAPPSVHPSGARYQWLIPPKGLDSLGADPAAPPAWLWELIRTRRARSRPVREIISGVPEGERNISAAAVAGKLLGCLPVEDWIVAWEALRGWNALNKPPLDERQLRYTFDCIARREFEKRARVKNEHQKLLEKLVQFLKNNHSQREIAKAIGINQSTVSRLYHSLITSKRITFESKISNGS